MRSTAIALLAAAAAIALPASAHGAVTLVSPIPFSVVEGQRIDDDQRLASFGDTGACAPGAYTATISWGDGTVEAGDVVSFDQFEAGGGPNCNYYVVGRHEYGRAGVYALSVTVCGPGAPCVTGTRLTGVTVLDAPIRGEALAIRAAAGRPFTGEVAEFNDDNRSSQPGDFTAVVDWGDGTTSAGIMGGKDGRLDVSGQHTYAAPGSYLVRVSLLEGGVVKVTSDPATAVIGEAGSLTPIQSVQTPSRSVVGTARLGPSLRVRTTSIRRRSLSRGLPVRLVAPRASSFRLSVVRLGATPRTLARVTLRVRSGLLADGMRISDSRVRLSSRVRSRMRAGRHELRLRLADGRLLRARFRVI